MGFDEKCAVRFENWLIQEKEYSDNTVEMLVVKLTFISENFFHLMCGYQSFFLVNKKEEMNLICKRLASDLEFVEANKNRNNGYLNAIKNYYEFVSVVINHQKKNDLDEKCTDEVFKDFDFDETNKTFDQDQALIASLLQKGIDVFEQYLDVIDQEKFSQMEPEKFILQGDEIEVSSWREIFIYLCELLFQRYPYLMKQIIDKPIGIGGLPVISKSINGEHYKDTLENGLFVASELSGYDYVFNAITVCKKCKIIPEEFEIYVYKDVGNKIISQIGNKISHKQSKPCVYICN